MIKDIVKAKMKEKGIKTFIQFAEEIGEDTRALRKMFERNDCKVSILLKMCEVLEATPDEILGHKKNL